MLMAELEGMSLYVLFVSITDSVYQHIIRHGYESLNPLTPLGCCELLPQGHVIEHRVATVRWGWNFCLLGVKYHPHL